MAKKPISHATVIVLFWLKKELGIEKLFTNIEQFNRRCGGANLLATSQRCTKWTVVKIEKCN